jgi:hypothetical protein
VQQDLNSSDNEAGYERDQWYFLSLGFLRLADGYRNAWREHGLERFVIQMSIVH